MKIKKQETKLLLYIAICLVAAYFVIFGMVLIISKGDPRASLEKENKTVTIVTDSNDVLKNNGPEKNNRYSSTFSPKFGNPEANISFVMFFDFDCIYCKQQYSYLRELMDTYKDYVYFEFRNMPFDVLHENTYALSNAAMCASSQGKFWEMFDEIYKNFEVRQYIASSEIPSLISIYANNIGLNIDMFNDCYNNERYENVIKKDYVDGVSYGVAATPTVFVNGTKLSGVISKENLEKLFVTSIEK